MKNTHFESNDLYTVTRDGKYYILTYDDGSKYYWLHGVCQRENGPAVIFKNGKVWFGWDGFWNHYVQTWDEFIKSWEEHIIKNIIE